MSRTHRDLEARTLGLSIATFRYIPSDLRGDATTHVDYLNSLNTALLTRIQGSGEAFISNAVIDGVFFLRACIVNFRTTSADVAALPEIVARLGVEVDGGMRRKPLPRPPQPARGPPSRRCGRG